MAVSRVFPLAPAIFAASLLGSCNLTTPTTSRTPAKVIQGGTLIDGTINKPVPNAVVVVESGIVVAVGPAKDVKIPDGSTITNASGLYVTPTQTGAVLAYGSPANIYLLNANPLDNPFVLASPTRIMKAGEWSDASGK